MNRFGRRSPAGEGDDRWERRDGQRDRGGKPRRDTDLRGGVGRDGPVGHPGGPRVRLPATRVARRDPPAPDTPTPATGAGGPPGPPCRGPFLRAFARGRWRWPFRARAGARDPADGGVSTVLACGIAAVLVAVTVSVLVLAAAMTARQRAGGAADLAALAAAVQVLSGGDTACAAADRVATANGARLESCRVEGLRAWVTTGVPVRVGVLVGVARGRALAGPAEGSGGGSAEGSGGGSAEGSGGGPAG